MPITWRNVNAPSNNQAGFFAGADLFSKGIEGLSNVFKDAQAKQDSDKLKIDEAKALEDAFGIQGMTQDQLANIDIRGKSKSQIQAITAARDNRAKDLIIQSNTDRTFKHDAEQDRQSNAREVLRDKNASLYKQGSLGVARDNLGVQRQRLTNQDANADRSHILALSNSSSSNALRGKQLELTNKRITNEINKETRANTSYTTKAALAAKAEQDKERIKGAKNASTVVNDDGSITYDPTLLTDNGATNQEAYDIIKGNEATALQATRDKDLHSIKKQELSIKQQAQDQKGRTAKLSKDDLEAIDKAYGDEAVSIAKGLSGNYPPYVISKVLAGSKEKTFWWVDNSFNPKLINPELNKFDEEFKLEAAKRALTGSQ